MTVADSTFSVPRSAYGIWMIDRLRDRTMTSLRNCGWVGSNPILKWDQRLGYDV